MKGVELIESFLNNDRLKKKSPIYSLCSTVLNGVRI